MATDPHEIRHPWPCWQRDAARPEVDANLRERFAGIDADVASRHPVCELSGRCCNFDACGHRLYATGLEIAWLLRQRAGPTAAPPSGPRDRGGEQAIRSVPGGVGTTPGPRLPVFGEGGAPSSGPCPFQVGRLCSVHRIRPLGCRLFFCDPSAVPWLNEVHEQHLAELRRLHERFDVPYAYMEWRAGLAAARTALGGWLTPAPSAP